MTTKIKAISPVLFDGKWHQAGEEFDVPDDFAKAEEAKGAADIVSRDGHAVLWASCCGQAHS